MSNLLPATVQPLVSLSALAAEVAVEHQKAQRSATAAIAHARRAGELLLAAKARLPHGQWLPWLKENCAFAERTAQRYMTAATPLPKSDNVSYLPGVQRSAPRGKPRKSARADAIREKLKAAQHASSTFAHARHVISELPRVTHMTKEYRQVLADLRYQIDELLSRSPT